MQAYQKVTSPIRENLETLESPYRKKLYDARFSKLADAARVAGIADLKAR